MANRCVFPIRPGKKVLVEVTNHCDAECLHCSNISSPSGAEYLSHDRLIALLDELVVDGFNQIYFSGGEPLLREGFFEVLKLAREKFKDVKLSTNGNRLDRSTVESIAFCNPDAVGISLDAPDAVRHDAFRNLPGLFDRATIGLRMLSEAGVRTRLQFTMTPMTVSEVSAMYHLGIKLKAGAVLFQFAVPTGRADGDQRLMLSSEEIEKATREVLGLMTSSKAPGYPDVYFCLPPEKRQKFGPEQTSLFLSSCPGGDRFLHVRADGRVSPCSWASKVAGAAVTSKKSLVDWPLADCLKDQVFDRFRLFSERINFDASFTSLISFGHLFPCQVVSKLAAVGRTESEGL